MVIHLELKMNSHRLHRELAEACFLCINFCECGKCLYCGKHPAINEDEDVIMNEVYASDSGYDTEELPQTDDESVENNVPSTNPELHRS